MGNISTNDMENKLIFIETSGLNSKTTGATMVCENAPLKNDFSCSTLRFTSEANLRD
jgi:hypothetical protein